MIPFKASVDHDPDNGSFGDCFRTVIASILNTDPEYVPHFFRDGDPERSYQRIDEWLLGAEGLRYVETRYPGEQPIEEFLNVIGLFYPGLYVIVGGNNGRGDHVVIALDGTIVADPAMYGPGLVGPTSAGYYAVGFLVSGKHKA